MTAPGEEIDEQDWDGYGTCWCGYDLSGRDSHFHCANCGEISSAFGHWKEPEGFSCARAVGGSSW